MKKITKECKNANCTKYEKKIEITDKSAIYCTSCGEPLYHVCKKCHTVLIDDKKILCERCKVSKEQTDSKIGAAVGGAVIAAVGVAAKVIFKK